MKHKKPGKSNDKKILIPESSFSITKTKHDYNKSLKKVEPKTTIKQVISKKLVDNKVEPKTTIIKRKPVAYQSTIKQVISKKLVDNKVESKTTIIKKEINPGDTKNDLRENVIKVVKLKQKSSVIKSKKKSYLSSLLPYIGLFILIISLFGMIFYYFFFKT